MKTRAKHLPRLWCALQGLLPFDACVAAQRGELAWPAEDTPRVAVATVPTKRVARATSSRSPKAGGTHAARRD